MAIKFDANFAAKSLYSNTLSHVSRDKMQENPFAGARLGLGIGQVCYTDIGQVNGEAPTQYYTNSKGYTEVVQRTLNYFG